MIGSTVQAGKIFINFILIINHVIGMHFFRYQPYQLFKQ